MNNISKTSLQSSHNLLEKNKNLKKELKQAQDKLKDIENKEKRNKNHTCVDCGSLKGKPRNFSFGTAGSYNSIQCDICWTETLYEDLLD